MNEYLGLAFDLDGTTVGDGDRTVKSQRVVDAFAALPKDILAIAVTGRSKEVARPVLHDLGLRHESIVSNGALIISPSYAPITQDKKLSKYKRVLSEEKIAEIKAVVELERPGEDFNFSSHQLWMDGDGSARKIITIAEHEARETPSAYIKDVPEEAASILLQRILEVPDTNAFLSDAWNKGKGMKDVSIFHAEARKNIALKKVLKAYNMDPARMIGIGDGVNDFDLFKAVGRKIAVANAHPDLIAQADEVAPPQSEDGIVQVLQEYFIK